MAEGTCIGLVRQVEMAQSYLQSVSCMSHFIILGLLLWFWVWLSGGSSEPTSGGGDMDRFNLEKHFWPTLKIRVRVSCSVLLNSYPKR